MAIVVTNGECYICYSSDGGIRKTFDFEKAIIYDTITNAIQDMKRAPAKTEKYYVYDTATQHICWKWLTNEEKAEYIRQRKIDKKKAVKRKNYTQSVRKMIYSKANGTCQLCGRKIAYEEMTLDHIKPLAMGGADSVENLACTCKSCNQFKSSILPEEFMERITRIFLYQMEKKTGNSLKWKILHKLLENII